MTAIASGFSLAATAGFGARGSVSASQSAAEAHVAESASPGADVGTVPRQAWPSQPRRSADRAWGGLGATWRWLALHLEYVCIYIYFYIPPFFHFFGFLQLDFFLFNCF